MSDRLGGLVCNEARKSTFFAFEKKVLKKEKSAVDFTKIDQISFSMRF